MLVAIKKKKEEARNQEHGKKLTFSEDGKILKIFSWIYVIRTNPYNKWKIIQHSLIAMAKADS